VCSSRSSATPTSSPSNDDFIEFAKDLALHIAASPQRSTSNEEGDPAGRQGRRGRASSSSRPPTSRRTSGPRSSEGKLKAWYKDVVLLDQEHVNGDKHDGKTIEQLRAALSAKTGENVVIKRFVRFAVGE